MKTICKTFIFASLLLTAGLSFAQSAQKALDFSAQKANRQTALRYLKLAKNYAIQGDWKKTLAAATAGNNYDATVADLWYLIALSQYNGGATRKAVLPVLKNSLSGAEWVDYNKSSARIFYADLLCSTGKPREALDILDQRPFIYSADADYVRIKSYYTLGDAASVQSAREKVDVSRRIYPADERFPNLFFAYEYKIMYQKNFETGTFDYMPLDSIARKTADYFITRVPEYNKQNPELEVYAAIFAEGEQRTRLLKAFDARGFKSPIFAAAALEDGVFTESQAFDYFLDFMDKGVDLFDLERFASVLKTDEGKKRMFDYLNAYSGTLYIDTNRSLERNVTITYSRGRPAQIIYDADNDGGDDWTAELDFGVPKSAHFEDKKIDVYYGTYPSPVRIVFEEVPGEEGITIFNLADETVDAEIFTVKADEFLAAAGFRKDFYIVDENSLWSGPNLFDVDRLILSISSMEKPSKERDGAIVRFSMLDGAPYAADYLVDGKLYARAQFTKPLTRSVDRDGDMIFETTEIYADNDGSFVASKEDEDAASQNIWGYPVPNPLIYLQMIHIDRNGDTIPDFTEEYLTKGGRRTSWDSDYDGNWNVRYTLYPQEEGLPLVELTEFFIQGNGKKLPVSIKLSDGEPVEIKVDSANVPVTKGTQNCFYWVDKPGTENQELNLIGFMKGVEQGVVKQMDSGDYFFQAVVIGQNIYARVLEKSDEVKKAQKENAAPNKKE
ncbi:MAG: hypothetical protein VZQ47_01405 [Treponema sp.]|nr:hypothetical protein [Treponema sp.]MEE3434199.1 hypothetical protein [Treponema sp.]